MKKWIFFLAALSSMSLFAQQPELENGDFENWEIITWGGGNTYEDYSATNTSDLIKTLNSLIPINVMGIPTSATAFKVNEAFEGNHAIKLVSAQFGDSTTSNLFVPGVLGTIPDDFAETFIATDGIYVTLPFGYKPKTLEGAYKYFPINGDSAVIEVELYEDNLQLACGYLRQKDTVSEWTLFKIDIEYDALFEEDGEPTDLKMLFVASAGYDFEDLFNCQGQVGSALFLDDLKFGYETGITEYLMPKVAVKTFPNPVAETAQFDFDKEVNGYLAFYDMQGRTVTAVAVEGNSTKVNLSDLSHGTYIYRLISGNEILCTGKIVKE